MSVVHSGPPASGVVNTRGNPTYVPASLHGVKRRCLCAPLQAKSRRRSTQGIVHKDLMPGGPGPERRKSEDGAKPDSEDGAKPDWVRELEQDAEEDEDIAEMLQGANGNPDIINQRIQAAMEGKRTQIISENAGELEQMGVEFREVDPFNLWVWFELYRPPSGREAEMLEEVLASWFMLGRLGAFNAQNLQVFYKANEEISYMDYEAEECETGLSAFFHDMTQLELNNNWARCWINLGTSDELALDMLINALSSFSRENTGIKKLYIGGENEDWPIPEVQLPKATMNPMQGPVDMQDY